MNNKKLIYDEALYSGEGKDKETVGVRSGYLIKLLPYVAAAVIFIHILKCTFIHHLHYSVLFFSTVSWLSVFFSIIFYYIKCIVSTRTYMT